MLTMEQWKEEVSKLDDLIALLVNSPTSPESLIALEHVQSARGCALESMPAECEFDLKLAWTAIRQIDDEATRQNAEKILSSLPPGTRLAKD